MFSAIGNWIGNNGGLAAGLGSGLATVIIFYFVAKIDWNKIWSVVCPIGIGFDKALLMKFGWADGILENIGTRGVLPALVAFLSGMIGTDQKLKNALVKMLIDMAVKLGYVEKK